RHIEIFMATINTEERQKEDIARNLHDTINPNLSTVQRLLKTHRENLESITVDAGKVTICEEMVAQCVIGIREACFDLVPHALSHMGLVKAIEQLAFNIAKSKAAECEFDTAIEENVPEEATLKSQLNIYRVTQELL